MISMRLASAGSVATAWSGDTEEASIRPMPLVSTCTRGPLSPRITGRLAPGADATPVQVSAGQPWPVDLADDLKAPVLGLYGGQDQGIPLASVERMRQALARAGQTDSRIVVYPDAPHGFHADYRASYVEADAKDGWSKLLATFDKALKN